MSSRRGSKEPGRLVVRLLLQSLASRTAVSMVAGALLVKLFEKLREWMVRRRRVRAELLWRNHVDFADIQACIMTTEHLETLGRVEKRTLFVKPMKKVFRNEYILGRLLEVAERAAADGEPMLLFQLSPEDKWHVINTCINRLSACFAPYHVFFNEARRTDTYYKSAWYCFTLTCARTEAPGRWFITPNMPVGVEDVGNLRIRIMLMNEAELRDIASGAIEPPSFGLFNGRHESRWKLCLRIAELFNRQVQHNSPAVGTLVDQSSLLSGGNEVRRIPSMSENANLGSVPAYQPEDNSIHRIHIPFPGNKWAAGSEVSRKHEENVSKDVVLYE